MRPWRFSKSREGIDMAKETKFFGYKAAVGAFLVIFANLGACTTLGTFIATLANYSGHSVGAVGQIATVNTICNIVLSVVALKALGKAGRQKDYADIRNRLRGAYDILYVCHAGGKSPEPDIHVYCGRAGILCHYLWNPCGMLFRYRRMVRGETGPGDWNGAFRRRTWRGSMGIPCGPGSSK